VDSFNRFLKTPEGKAAYFDLLAAVAVAPTDDRAFDGFRHALEAAEMSAEGLLTAAERELEERGDS